MDDAPPWFDEAWVQGFGALDARLDLAEVDGFFRVPRAWDTHWVCLDEWLVYHVDHGRARLRCRHDAPRDLHPGDLICLPAGCAFRVQAQDPAAAVCIRRFRFARPGRFATPLVVPGCPQVAPLLDEIIEEAGMARAPLHPERVAALLTALFTTLLRQLRHTGRSLPAYLVRQVRLWAAEHSADPIAPAALARHLGLSHDYFTRLFRRSFGCPPRRWLLLQRLNQVAVQLRETDRSLDDLAREFGYQDQKLLGRQFQRHLGLSPGRYRRRFRGL